MANPYYVKAGPGLGGTLSGFGEILEESRARKTAEAGKTALKDAWASQDPQAIADVAIQYPELSGQAKKLGDLTKTLETGNLRSMAKGSIELKNIPNMEGRVEYLTNRISEVEGRGGDSSHSRNLLKNIEAGISIEDQNINLDNTVNLAQRFGAIDKDASSLPPSKAQFGGQETIKDSKNNQYFITSTRDPNTGQTKTSYAPIGDAPDQPIGAIEFTGRYGLTSKEAVSFKGETRTVEEQAEADIRAATEPDIQKDIALSKVTGKLLGEDIDLLENMEASLPQLRDVTAELKGLVNDATFTTTGKVWNTLAKEAGYSTKGGTARARMESIADNEILPLLKQTFGAAFTEGEGARLRKTLIDPDAAPGAKMASLEAFINSKERQIRTLKKKTGTAEAPQEYPEGTVISNGAGQKMQMTNGQWVNI